MRYLLALLFSVTAAFGALSINVQIPQNTDCTGPGTATGGLELPCCTGAGTGTCVGGVKLLDAKAFFEETRNVDGQLTNEEFGRVAIQEFGRSLLRKKETEEARAAMNQQLGEENTEFNDSFPVMDICTCGDGEMDTTPGCDWDEECDDAGESLLCDDDCTFVECGDGNINETAGEQCDDGNTDDGDDCDSLCQLEIAQADLPTDVHLAWDSPLDAEGYNVYFSHQPGEYDNPIWQGETTAAVIGGLDPCDHYFAIVRILYAHEQGESPPSNEIEFIVDEEECDDA